MQKTASKSGFFTFNRSVHIGICNRALYVLSFSQLKGEIYHNDETKCKIC